MAEMKKIAADKNYRMLKMARYTPDRKYLPYGYEALAEYLLNNKAKDLPERKKLLDKLLSRHKQQGHDLITLRQSDVDFLLQGNYLDSIKEAFRKDN